MSFFFVSEYLGNDLNALYFFQRGIESGEAFAHYKIAQGKRLLEERML